MKIALITGVLGQDGYFLSKYLSKKKYKVYGVDISFVNISSDLNKILEKVYEIDISKKNSLKKIIKNVKPDEIYHLAAYHFSSQNDGNKKESFDKFYKVNFLSTNEILDTIFQNKLKCKLFYASSCQVFGDLKESPQNEKTNYNPNSFYTISKTAATHLCEFYRNYNNIYASVGILYNHESYKRNSTFITKKIVETAVSVYNGKNEKLKIRDINAEIDWGDAEDFVQAFWSTLQQKESDTYIISSGKTHSIKQFAKIAFDYLDLDYRKYIFQDPDIISKQKIPYLGDNSKIFKKCNWKPNTSFKKLIKKMIDHQKKINK